MSIHVRLRARIFGHPASRFLVPVFIILVLRLLDAAALYSTLAPAAAIHSTLHNELYIFAAWDSEHYDSIARVWYPDTPSVSWAWFPLYPTLIRLLSLVGLDPSIGALLISTVSGLISVVLFQKIADGYLSPDRAFTATLVYFLLPPVFVFCAVSYSDPVFLLLSLLCWYYYLRENDLKSSLAATMSSLTRSYGVLIAIPLAWGYVARRQYRRLVFCIPPIASVTGWMLYSLIRTGTFAPTYVWKYWRSVYFAMIEQTIAEGLAGHFVLSRLIEHALQYFSLMLVSLASLALVIVLTIRTFRVDRRLGVYMLVAVSSIFFVTFPISLTSFPRYFAFLFPIGFTLGTKRQSLLLIGLIVLAALDYFAWNAFLTDGFF